MYKKAMIVLAMVTIPSVCPRKSETIQASKYQEFADVFDKVKASKLHEH